MAEKKCHECGHVLGHKELEFWHFIQFEPPRMEGFVFMVVFSVPLVLVQSGAEVSNFSPVFRPWIP